MKEKSCDNSGEVGGIIPLTNASRSGDISLQEKLKNE
jgi:hypothetical protein